MSHLRASMILCQLVLCTVGRAADQDKLPDVPLHSPWMGNRADRVLPADGMPLLVFPLAWRDRGVEMDLIRALRYVPVRFAERMKIVLVLVNVKDLPPLDVVYGAIEFQTLLRTGLKGPLPSELEILKDDSGEWFEQLGHPELPHGLLADSKGVIQGRRVFKSDLEWELQRIAAVVEGKAIPRAENAETETYRQEAKVHGHPFYRAVVEIEPTKDGDIPWPELVKAITDVDRKRGLAVLREYAENSMQLGISRGIAESCVKAFGESECQWAKSINDSLAKGRVSPSLWQDEYMAGIELPADSLEMNVTMTTELRTYWDDQVAGRLEQSAIVKPGTEITLFSDYFKDQNLGWGDYVAKHTVKVGMYDPDAPRGSEPPSIVRTKSDFVSMGPRPEVEPVMSLSTDSRADPDGEAFRRGMFELGRTIRQQKRDAAASPEAEEKPLVAKLVGKAMPTIGLKEWRQGREIAEKSAGLTVDSFGGNVVLLDFMFVECPACRIALPKLVALHAKYREKGFAVVSLCAEWGEKDLHELVRQLEIKHPVAVITKKTEEAFHLKAFPTYVLIDRKGKVSWASVGDEPGEEEIVRALAEKREEKP